MRTRYKHDKDKKVDTPIRSIRKKCLDCSNKQVKEVKHCTVYRCPIWPYRMGRRPRPEDMKQEESHA